MLHPKTLDRRYSVSALALLISLLRCSYIWMLRRLTPDRPRKLIHRDSVVYKRFGIVKVRIVSPITDDQVIRAYIYTEMLDQVLLRTSGNRCFVEHPKIGIF